jgi:hypothetical protein
LSAFLARHELLTKIFARLRKRLGTAGLDQIQNGQYICYRYTNIDLEKLWNFTRYWQKHFKFQKTNENIGKRQQHAVNTIRKHCHTDQFLVGQLSLLKMADNLLDQVSFK